MHFLRFWQNVILLMFTGRDVYLLTVSILAIMMVVLHCYKQYDSLPSSNVIVLVSLYSKFV